MRAIVAAMGVALCGMGCSGFEPGDDRWDGGRDALFETSVEPDGAASDASVEGASTNDEGDVTRADVVPGDAGVPDAPPTDAPHADAATTDSIGDDAANHDAATRPDVTNARDATVADAAPADSAGLDASPMDTAPRDGALVVISGNITEFPSPITLSHVSEIVAGPDGALWLPDPLSGNLLRVTTTGQFSLVRVPGHAPDGSGISEPQSLIVGADGHFWFAERNSDDGAVRITRMTLDGVFTSFVLLYDINPVALAPGSDGNIWFLDAKHGAVVRLTENGEVTSFGRPGSSSVVGDGMIAGPDGNLWFVEQNPGKIGKMTTGGVFTEFATTGLDDSIGYIALGPDANVWFTERSRARVWRITPGGAMDMFALRGPDAEDAPPMGITSGPDGNLWITLVGQISSITPDGATVKNLCAHCRPSGITTGSDGRIWYVDAFRGFIGRIS
jgi:streptogramin lyase